MTKRAAEAGFTLVETLVAIFALALLMSAGGALLLSTLRSNHLVDARLARVSKLEVATAHLRADLGFSVTRLARSVRTLENGKSFYGGTPNSNDVVLGLVRSGWINIANEDNRSELLGVEYRFRDGQLVRSIYQSPDRTRRTPVSETVLVGGLQSLQVEFIAGGLNVPEWDLTLEADVPVLPDAVTIDMVFETGERLSQSFLVGSTA